MHYNENSWLGSYNYSIHDYVTSTTLYSFLKLTHACSQSTYKLCELDMVRITHNLNGTRMLHTCDIRGVNYTHVGFFDSTCVHMHTQYLHTRVFLHVCMLVWLMYVAS